MLAIAAFVVAAGPAWSAVKRDPRGDMRVPGLTKAERSAMDITRISTLYDGAGLLIVDVRVAGNINGLMGRGHLRRALAGIMIQPRRGRSTAIVTTGSRRAARAGERGPADALLVDRDRNQIRFIATGVKNLRRVGAATVPRPSSRGAGAGQRHDPGDEFEFVKLFVFEFAFKIAYGIEDERDQAARDQRDFEWTCAAARRLEEEMDREEQELLDRAAQAEEAERAQIEAVIDRLLGVGAGTRSKVESCAGGGGGLPEDFKTSWAHGMGKSRICVYVTGRDGQTGDVTVNGTAEPNPVKPFTLDAQGARR